MHPKERKLMGTIRMMKIVVPRPKVQTGSPGRGFQVTFSDLRLAAADPFDAVATHFISLPVALLQRKKLCGDTRGNAGLVLLQWRN
jgi:hypothetical protein